MRSNVGLFAGKIELPEGHGSTGKINVLKVKVRPGRERPLMRD